MRAAVVRRPSLSIYLIEAAESKIGQEIFARHPFSSKTRYEAQPRPVENSSSSVDPLGSNLLLPGLLFVPIFLDKPLQPLNPAKRFETL
jgi:hypothetical protein